ncbi:hypothetical protein [Herbidospora mongoliensis]|uniref:hypothetical protein n=1 Tax=Herbidospora mongoliensis TaxID=688067 RepID=UPI00082F6A75|nr:hypothetical protein [Herbidospora mongoliensis]
MSSYHYLFVRPRTNPARLLEDLTPLFGADFERIHREYADFRAVAGQVVVEVAFTHGFGIEPQYEDRDMPLSRYPICVTFRFSENAVTPGAEATAAWRGYHGLEKLGGYDLLLTYDFQQVLAASPPLEG